MTEPVRDILIPQFVTEILDRFEAEETSFLDCGLSGALSEAIGQHKDLPQQSRNGWWAEMAAFCFDHCQPGQQSCWGTHFGPVMKRTDKAGKEHNSPSLDEVGSEVLAHWRKRVDEAKNPILRARYADLIWDLSRACTGQRAGINYARIAIDAYIAASEIEPGDLRIDQTQRLGRALELGLSIRDTVRVEDVRDAMFRFYETHVLSRDDQGLWCFLFDAVYANKRIPVHRDQLQSLVAWLEHCLQRCTTPDDPKNFSPWTAKEVAFRLARSYHDESKPEEIRRVITSYGNAFVHLAKQADGILAVGWLQGVYEDYVNFGLRNEAEHLLLLCKAKGAEVPKQMATIKGSYTIPKEELEQVINAMVTDDLQDSLHRIAHNFIPRVADAKDLLKRLSADDRVTSHIGIRVVSEDQIIAEAGSIHEDEEGRLVMQIAENLSFGWVFLTCCLKALRERHDITAECIVSHLLSSPVFDGNRRVLLMAGVKAYLDEDFIKAIHVLVPQIEYVMRRFLALLGRPTSKHIRSNLGVMQEKSLDDVLSDIAVRAALPEYVWRYFTALLADRRGWNLRNRLAHGLMNPADFNRQVADYVLHALLTLALIRPNANETQS